MLNKGTGFIIKERRKTKKGIEKYSIPF